MILLTVLLFAMLSSQPKPKLIYIGDPMCSWCYGIAPELEAVEAHYTDKIPFEVVLGGLRPYNTETMSDLKGFLTEHWKEVNAMSGQPFQYDILNQSGITYDTEPPCRATVVVRDMHPEKTFKFFKSIQKDFYYENKNMHLPESYAATLDELNIDRKEFNRRFSSDEMKQKVRKDFERAGQLGVRSFPTLILQRGDDMTVIANGYATADKMIQRIDRLTR